MAPSLLRALQKDMLLLWDRGFLSYALVQQVQTRQAQLLARIKKNLVFKPLKRLGDGCRYDHDPVRWRDRRLSM
jgi:hypothetical protein